MKNLSIGVCILIALAACKGLTQKGDQRPADPLPDSTKKQSYLPVADLVKADIRQVDSFAGGILKKTIINKKKDSAYIQPAAFHQLAQSFLPQELDSASFQQHFTESSFMDESIQLLNFIYTPDQSSVPLRKVVMYISPNLGMDQVNRLYMEKEWEEKDTLVRQKLTWKFRAYFMIVTVKQPKQGAVITSVTQVIWRPDLFSTEL